MTKIAPICPHLRVRREFLAAAAKGRKYVRPTLVLQALCRPKLDSDKNIENSDTLNIQAENIQAERRFGLTASKKVGNAVARNRARRRLRALAQTHIPQFGRDGFDYVLIARTTTLTCRAATLAKDLETALKGVHNVDKTTKENKSARK